MKRGAPPGRFLSEAEDRGRHQREAAIAKKRDLVSVLRPRPSPEVEAEASEGAVVPPSAEVEAFAKQLAALSLWTPEGARAHPALTYQALSQAMFEAVTTGRSCAVLAWPTGNVSLAAAHALAAQALLHASPLEEGSIPRRIRPRRLRALFYPFSSRTRLPLRQVFLDRQALGRISAEHLADGRLRSGPLYANLLRLVRVKDLTGRVRGGAHHFEYEHPDLDEVVAVTGPRVDHPVMHRVANRTDLAQLSNTAEAAASCCPFAIVGAVAGQRLDMPSKDAEPLDLVLLDLTRSGRNRFHRDWRAETTTMLSRVREKLGHLPVLAVTDDPWVHRVLAWELLKEHDGIPRTGPACFDAVLARSPAIAVTVPEQFEPPTAVERFEAQGFADTDGQLLDDLAAAARRADALHDEEARHLFFELTGVVRRTASLPGGVSALGRFIAEEADPAQTAELMAAYRADRLLREGEALNGPFAQRRRPVLAAALSRTRALIESRAQSSPLGRLVTALVAKRLNASTRTIVWLPKAMISEFAEHALKSDPEIGGRVAIKISRNMLAFVDALAFRELAALPRAELASTKVLIVVAPSRAEMLSLVTQTWLPDRVIVLADSHTLAGIGREAARLAQFDAFEPYRARLAALSACAGTEARRVFGHALELGDEALRPEPDFPESVVVDLVGRRHPGDKIVRIETEGRQAVLARPKTRVLVYDEDRPIPAFSARAAEDIERGDKICVINETFVDMARARLDIRGAAAEVIREYHDLVQRRFDRLPGDTKTAKLRRLVTLMQDPEVSEERAHRWVTLEAEQFKPLDLVVPKAPRERTTFMNFMKVLEVSADTAAYFWWWAVIATRKGRIKAALQLHEAYVSILVDPITAEQAAPQRKADIRSLRRAAEGYVSTVTCKAIEREGPS